MAAHRTSQRSHGNHIGTLGDCLVEQTARFWRDHEQDDTESASGFTCNCDIVRVPAKGSDIALDPFQGCSLIFQAIIARDILRRLGAEFRMGKIAEHAEPVIDCNDDEPRFTGKVCAVVHCLTAGAGNQRAAMDPDEDRSIIRAVRHPDIEAKAILAHLT